MARHNDTLLRIESDGEKQSRIIGAIRVLNNCLYCQCIFNMKREMNKHPQGNTSGVELTVVECLRWSTAARAIRTEHRIIVRKPQEIPCAWKEVRELEAKWTVTPNGAEAALTGDKDQVYIALGDHAPAEAGCPIHYVWMETSDPNMRVVHKLKDGPE